MNHFQILIHIIIIPSIQDCASLFEVEIKAHLDDLTRIQSGLIQLGALYKKTFQQTDIYLQHPIRNFAQTDEALRIRYSEDKNYITYKGPKIDQTSKTREEIEIEFHEPDKLLKLLRKIGFTIVREVSKFRQIYALDEITICLDTINGLGNFIELEIDVSNENEIIIAKNQLLLILDKLQIPSNKLERRSYLELLLIKKRSI